MKFAANTTGILATLHHCGDAAGYPGWNLEVLAPSPEVGVNILRDDQVIRVYRAVGYPVLDTTLAQIVANRLLGVTHELPGGYFFSETPWVFSRTRNRHETIEAFTDRHTADMIQQAIAEYYVGKTAPLP